jgi:hypothetical protein
VSHATLGVGQDEGEWGMGAEGGPDGLVAAPRKVERVAISYAQASKQVRRMDHLIIGW